MADVPAIPIASLMAVSDPQTREVLRAIADGIAIRNGNVGNGGKAFLTLDDLTKSGYTLSAVANAIARPIAEGIKGGSELQDLGDALEDRILGSAAWRAMFTRLKLIDSPDTVIGSFAYNLLQEAKRLGVAIADEVKILVTADESNYKRTTGAITAAGDAVAGTLAETILRVNKDNAIAGAVNTMWATFGSNSALFEDGQLAAVNATGAVATKWNQVQTAIRDPITGNIVSSSAIRTDLTSTSNLVTGLSAKWGIKIDLSTAGKAYVTGVSLNASVSPGGVTESSFIVLADTFAIGAPGKPDIVPFAIDTTNGLVRINGNLVATGTVDASKIDTRGLTIKDLNGNIILGSGTALSYGNVSGGPPSNANYTYDTSQLNDGAGLGLRAQWNNIAGQFGAPASFATVGADWSTNVTGASGVNSNIANAAGTSTWNGVSGAGKPEAYATVGANFFTNLQGQINSGNISTFIAGAAITNAYIGNAAILNANIGRAAVDTLSIAGNSVTVGSGSSGYTSTSIGIGTTGGRIMVMARASVYNPDGGSGSESVGVSILKNGSIIDTAFSTSFNGQTTSVVIFTTDQPGPNEYITYTARAENGTNNNFNGEPVSTYLSVQEFKR